MLDDFMVRALVAGIALASMSSALGCFVVWKRMAYFGDALSHSGLLGIWLGLFLGWQINLALILVCLLFSFLLAYLRHVQLLTTDTLLGVLAHTAFAVGLVLMSLSNYRNFDLHAYLFGDILTISLLDVYWTLLSAFLVLILIKWFWPKFVLIALSEELSKAENIHVFYYHLCFMTIVALVVAIAIPVFGVLLVSAILIIPAASARQFSNSPKMMVIFAIFISNLMIVLGIFLSFVYDIFTSPVIVVIGSLIFVISLFWKK